MATLKAIIDAFCPPLLRNFKERIEASLLGYRLANGAFWSLVGSLVSRGSDLLSAS